MSVAINGTNGITYNDGSLQPSAPVGRNLIINGNMAIDQRNAGASVTPINQQYTIDRWRGVMSQSSKFSVQQNAGSVTPPAGFSNYLGIVSLSAYSVPSSEVFSLSQSIEGYNIADLRWGTANAKTVTLSFQVYSSLTGTFGGSLQNASVNRSYPFSFTVSVANTWTTISITIAGDTSGSWNNTNSTGILLSFGLGAGSTWSGTAGAWVGANYYSVTGATSVVGTSGATFYVTGVQLEANTTATPFENLQYGQQLALCQRYFQVLSYVSGSNVAVAMSTATDSAITTFYYSQKRATPTVTLPPASKTNGISFLTVTGAYPGTVGTNTADRINVTSSRISGASYVGLAGAGRGAFLYATGDQVITISAEL